MQGIQELQANGDRIRDENTRDSFHDEIIAQDLKSKRRVVKGHKVRHMKRPMAIPHVILELQDEQCRESSLRCLSTFLLDKREEDPENYERTGYFLYNSCSTMAILLQEVVAFFTMMASQSLTVRASKRLTNVLTLLQCIAANREARRKFVNSSIPDFLLPVIVFRTPLEVYDNVRAVALSVLGILCQGREPDIIKWAIQSNVVEVCRVSIDIGNELSKVLGMHILEAILQNDVGLSYICSSTCNGVIQRLLNSWNHLVAILERSGGFSPRLLFHVIRCYVLLCNHLRGYNMVKENLPDLLVTGSFNGAIEEFPVIGCLRQLLLVIVGREGCGDKWMVAALPHDLLMY